MNLDHLKFCTSYAHAYAYSCARCHKTYCMECDHVSDVEMIKTICRYCPDWRCQREKRLEDGTLMNEVARERDAALMKVDKLRIDLARGDYATAEKLGNLEEALIRVRGELEEWKAEEQKWRHQWGEAVEALRVAEAVRDDARAASVRDLEARRQARTDIDQLVAWIEEVSEACTVSDVLGAGDAEQFDEIKKRWRIR